MPTYVYGCECGSEFEILQSSTLDSAECPYCTRITSKRIPQRPGLIVTMNGFEENNYKAKRPDKLHEARMENKRKVEENWHKVESGESEYSPGKTPEMYQPKQHIERSKKRLY